MLKYYILTHDSTGSFGFIDEGSQCFFDRAGGEWENVAITASTGIAATHLNGRTIHSWSGIGIKDIDEKTRNRIQKAKVLIIDEISMFHSYRLDMVNQVCKTLCKNKTAFGGLQVILCGNFFQLPPVTDPGKSQSCFTFKSDAWEELKTNLF